jgi:hypothetical protein
MLSASSGSAYPGRGLLSATTTMIRARMGAIQWLILCGVALVVAIALGTAYLAQEFRERALVVTERDLNNTALLLSRHFDQQLSDLQHVHDDIVGYMQAGRLNDADSFEQQMSTMSAMRCCAPSSPRFRMSALSICSTPRAG